MFITLLFKKINKKSVGKKFKFRWFAAGWRRSGERMDECLMVLTDLRSVI